jgi:hypothetical protein
MVMRSSSTAHRQISFEGPIVVPSYRSAHRDVSGERAIGKRRGPNASIAILSGESTSPQPNSVAVPDDASLQRIGCGCYGGGHDLALMKSELVLTVIRKAF